MLLEQIAGAQQALEAQLEILRHAATVGGDTASLAMAQSQLSRLGGLHQRIEQMHGGSLAAIRAEVMATVAVSQTMSQQARSTVASAHTTEMALHAAEAEARRVTGDFVHDFYERKIFDKFLDFASSEEEEAYRQREAERERAIRDALAEGTPEGNLRALELSKEQLLDAGRYGASDSPNYQSTLNRIDAAQEPLERTLGVDKAIIQQEAEAALAPTEAPLVSPDIIATLRSTGTIFADAGQTGHGVTRHRTTEPGPAINI